MYSLFSAEHYVLSQAHGDNKTLIVNPIQTIYDNELMQMLSSLEKLNTDKSIVLNLANQKITSLGLSLLFKYRLRFSSIILSGNQITSDCDLDLTRNLLNLKTPLHLDLSNNFIPLIWIETLHSVVTRTHAISLNATSDPRSLANFFQAMHNNPQLELKLQNQQEISALPQFKHAPHKTIPGKYTPPTTSEIQQWSLAALGLLSISIILAPVLPPSLMLLCVLATCGVALTAVVNVLSWTFLPISKPQFANFGSVSKFIKDIASKDNGETSEVRAARKLITVHALASEHPKTSTRAANKPGASIRFSQSSSNNPVQKLNNQRHTFHAIPTPCKGHSKLRTEIHALLTGVRPYKLG